MRPTPHRTYAEKTLLLASNHVPLKKALRSWCRENRVRLAVANPHHPDLVATPCRAVVVDRRYVGNTAWQDYLAFLPETVDASARGPDTGRGWTTGPALLVVDPDEPGVAGAEPCPSGRKAPFMFHIPPEETAAILSTLSRVFGFRTGPCSPDSPPTPRSGGSLVHGKGPPEDEGAGSP
jgi:hypothetical protein